MSQRSVRAKVFVSCGQREDAEVQAANAVTSCLEALGFDTYVAIEQKSLRGLRDNIFEELEAADYFLFIDFRREELGGEEPGIFRGSLFCHQEFALAAFLDLPVIALHERGVEKRPGIEGIVQANSVPFSTEDRMHLPALVEKAVRQEQWEPHSRRRLDLTDRPPAGVDALTAPAERVARFFGVPVWNRHVRRLAVNCYAYLHTIVNMATGQIDSPKTVELMWSGYTQPNAAIAAGASRLFDGFLVFHDEPNVAVVPAHTRSGYYISRIQGPGHFRLTYTVRAENFPMARGTFDVHLGEQLGEASIEPTGDEED